MSTRPGYRPAAVAGRWYPGTASELAAAVDDHLAAARDLQVAATGDRPGGPVNDGAAGATLPAVRPRALIVPHAGLLYSGPVAAYAYRLASAFAFDAIVLVGPSHFVPFPGVAVWPDGAWETPLGPVPVASSLAAAIAGRWPGVTERPVAHAREHSLEMQLPFVARLLPGVPIVPLVMGEQSRDASLDLAAAVADGIAAQGADLSRVLLVASSDLSHYEEADEAWRLDSVVVAHVEAFDPEGLMEAFDREPRHACGAGPMVAVLDAARRLGASRARVLRYADSGDVTGDKGAVVGYMAAAIW